MLFFLNRATFYQILSLLNSIIYHMLSQMCRLYSIFLFTLRSTWVLQQANVTFVCSVSYTTVTPALTVCEQLICVVQPVLI